MEEIGSGECINVGDVSYKLYFDCSTGAAPSDFEKNEDGYHIQYTGYYEDQYLTQHTDDCSGTHLSALEAWSVLEEGTCRPYYFLEQNYILGIKESCNGTNVEGKLYINAECNEGEDYSSYIYSLDEGFCSGVSTEEIFGCPC